MAGGAELVGRVALHDQLARADVGPAVALGVVPGLRRFAVQEGAGILKQGIIQFHGGQNTRSTFFWSNISLTRL